MSVHLVNDDLRILTAPLTKRFDLNVGKRCNERCTFCYYLEEIESGDTRDLSTEQIKAMLRVGKRWGKTRVDFTGGEPSIRKDLPYLFSYARSIGYETVCMITNGLVTAKREKLSEYVQAGLNDILVSLHAYDAKTHDHLVKHAGAHRKVLQTMANANALGISFRVNHVVNNLNFQDVAKLAELVLSHQPQALNFIIFNPTRDAIHADKEMDVSCQNVAEYLLPMLTTYSSQLAAINIRHIPFCFLKGFESSVKTMWQLQYEQVEWDWCMDIIHKRGLVFMYAIALIGMGISAGRRRFWQTDWNTRLHDGLQWMRIQNDRRHGQACGICHLREICDGLPKSYLQERGEAELQPYLDGPILSDPSHFIPRAQWELPPHLDDIQLLPNTPWMWFGQHQKKNNAIGWQDKMNPKERFSVWNLKDRR